MVGRLLMRTAIATALVSVGGVAGNAHAQNTANAPAQVGLALEEVVVTARRRDESLQDVPIAVSALSGQQADLLGIDGTDDLTLTTPSLDFGKQGGFGYIPFLRGVGSSTASAGFESPIAIYVDDVYLASPNSKLLSLDSIETVQVLKGPQGTLFGRNATGGVIQVKTKQPDFEQAAAKVSAGYGNYDTFEGSVYFNLPISDSVAFNLAANSTDQRDGYGKSIVTGKDTQTIRHWTVRANLLMELGENTQVKISADASDIKTDQGWNQGVFPGFVSEGRGTYAGVYNTSTIGEDYSTIEEFGLALDIRHSFSFADLVSITSYRDTKMYTQLDQDNGPVPLFDLIIDSPTESMSQELRLVSNSETGFQWVAGAFYMSTESSYEPACLCGLVGDVFRTGLPDPKLEFYNTQDMDSWSGFFEGTFEVTNATNLTVGVRYTEDTYQYIQNGVFLSAGGMLLGEAPGSTYQLDEETFDELTYRVILDTQLTDNVMGYISHSRGFKSGGYNLTEPGIPGLLPLPSPLEPEILDATEVGLKMSLLDDRLTFNAAAFYYDYQDLIVTSTREGSLSLLNAAAAEIYGFDADFVFAPAEGWRIAGGIGILDSEYTDFPEGPIFTPDTGTNPFGPPNNNGGGNNPGVANLTGNETQRSPELTLNISPSYSARAGAGVLTLAAHYYHNSGWFADPENRLEQPSYDLINATVNYEMDNGFAVQLWGKNLSDEVYYSFIQGGALNDAITWAPPRTYGITVSQEF